jgi:arginine decarboxylase
MAYEPRDQPTRDYLSTASNLNFARRAVWSKLGRTAERLDTSIRDGQATAGLEDALADQLAFLRGCERFWVYPGDKRLAELELLATRGDYDLLGKTARAVAWRVGSWGDAAELLKDAPDISYESLQRLPQHFVVLSVSDADAQVVSAAMAQVSEYRRPSDDLVYDVVVADSFEAGLTAALSNPDIQAVLLRYDFQLHSTPPVAFFRERLSGLEAALGLTAPDAEPRSMTLARLLRLMRPSLDLYLITDETLPEEHVFPYRLFRRIFYRYESSSEMHVSLLSGVRERYSTPFFDALKAYADRPIGNFHALPIARGNSIFNSRWIRDMGEFYGRNIFLAETSSTAGGLDSLLAPHASLKEAQDKAARTWGSMHTYFATNGTSTSNKIVVQAVTKPGDVVLIDRNCHKSHHYGLVMGGGHPIYLDSYPLQDYAIYGGVPLRTIKQQMLELRRAGRLDALKMVLLTNCTFDGINYNPLRVMEEVLAIKPDTVFLWDEAWFAFANAQSLVRRRTAMFAAQALQDKLASEEYRAEYEDHRLRMASVDPDDDAAWLDTRLLPDPDQTRVRVYATHSTHKSLSALRQGSMIHVYDQDFERKVAAEFHEAFNTHTSTSPNYQILASLDLARRQMDLEGYALVSRAYEIALAIRRRISEDTLLSRFVHVLEPVDLVPEDYRAHAPERYATMAQDYVEPWTNARKMVAEDEFVLDPTRITLHVAGTGLNGDEFKNELLMDRYGIQVNKTSINSVLLIITIGASWGAVDYLLHILHEMAIELAAEEEQRNPAQRRAFSNRVAALSEGLPPLPDFSEFHARFRPHDGSPEGDMRAAFFLAYDADNVEYVSLEQAADHRRVSSSFVVPYPPGFPILVPGQVVTPEVVDFMTKLDVSEIHGYEPQLGLAVFTQEALAV